MKSNFVLYIKNVFSPRPFHNILYYLLYTKNNMSLSSTLTCNNKNSLKHQFKIKFQSQCMNNIPNVPTWPNFLHPSLFNATLIKIFPQGEMKTTPVSFHATAANSILNVSKLFSKWEQMIIFFCEWMSVLANELFS